MSPAARGAAYWLVRGGLVALGIAPLVPALALGLPGLDALGRFLEAWFSFHCHREPERTLTGVAVCARCHGIYVGLGLGALVAKPRLRPPFHEAWILAGALLMLLDVASEALGWRVAWWPLRLSSGVLLAYPVSVLVVRALAGPEAAHT